MSNPTTTIREQLAAGRTATTMTKGVSMRPLLREGRTVVFLEGIRGADGVTRDLKPGDLPIYLRPDGKYVIHRLISADGGTYTTRGDNCLNSETIPREWVLGVVTRIHRKGRLISVDDPGYRAYVTIWTRLYPLRRIRLILRGKLHGLARRLTGHRG